MAWLQKRPQINEVNLHFSIGLNRTILIVGLGNLGDKYTDTRHNIGFKAVDHFTNSFEEFKGWSAKANLKSSLNLANMGDKQTIVMKPSTYMNNSGEAVAAVSNFYKIEPANILVIHDELDIPFGQIRTRTGGADAGHNGIKSVTEYLKTEAYGRLRIGIGPKKPDQIDSKDFVLQVFKDETNKLNDLYKEVDVMLTEYIYGSGQLNPETRSFIF